jgi:Polyketide cyclase / dehydrase and lipid transport
VGSSGAVRPGATGSVVVDCTPADAFRYAADPLRRGEWLAWVRRTVVETGGAPGVGMRVREVRRVPGAPAREIRSEYTHYQPGARWSLRALAGPLRPRETMTFAETDGGAATRVSLEVQFEGDGVGALYAALARRSAPKQVRADLAALKRRLDALQR